MKKIKPVVYIEYNTSCYKKATKIVADYYTYKLFVREAPHAKWIYVDEFKELAAAEKLMVKKMGMNSLFSNN